MGSTARAPIDRSVRSRLRWLLVVIATVCASLVPQPRTDASQVKSETASPCPACAGKGVETVACEPCVGTGARACPSCDSRPVSAAPAREPHAQGSFGVVVCRGCSYPPIFSGPSKKCTICRGKGAVRCVTCSEKATLTCPDCRGKKTVVITCRVCHGATTSPFESWLGSEALLDCARCAGIRIVPCPDCRKKDRDTKDIETVCRSCVGGGKVACRNCLGLGRHICLACVPTSFSLPRKNNGKCENCKGSRLVQCKMCNASKFQACKKCDGTGKLKGPCSRCEGSQNAPCEDSSAEAVAAHEALALECGVSGHVRAERLVLAKTARDAALLFESRILFLQFNVGLMAPLEPLASFAGLDSLPVFDGMKRPIDSILVRRGEISARIGQRIEKTGGALGPAIAVVATATCTTCDGRAAEPTACTVCTEASRLLCRVCVGRGSVTPSCVECFGAGVSPAIESDADLEICPWCRGATVRACTSCTAGERVLIDCASCERTGRTLCSDCASAGSTDCRRCELGVLEDGAKCTGCGGKGSVVCSRCKGQPPAQCRSCHGVGLLTFGCGDCGRTQSRPCDCCTIEAHRPWESAGDRFAASGNATSARRCYEIAKQKVLSIHEGRSRQLDAFEASMNAISKRSKVAAIAFDEIAATIRRQRQSRIDERDERAKRLDSKIATSSK